MFYSKQELPDHNKFLPLEDFPAQRYFPLNSTFYLKQEITKSQQISTLRGFSIPKMFSSQVYVLLKTGRYQTKTKPYSNQINHTEAYQIKATSSQHQLRNPPSLPFKLRTSHMPLLRHHLKIKIFWNDVFVAGGSCKIICMWDIQTHTQNTIQ